MRLKDAGIRPTEIVIRLGIGRASVYRVLKDAGLLGNRPVVASKKGTGFVQPLAAQLGHADRGLRAGGVDDQCLDRSEPFRYLGDKSHDRKFVGDVGDKPRSDAARCPDLVDDLLRINGKIVDRNRPSVRR
jgi:hypothetical protein